MDAVAALLDGPRAREAFVLRIGMARPWSIRVEDEAPLAVLAVVRGEAWVEPDGGDPVRLGPGDVAIARGPDRYTICDEPGRPPTVRVREGDRCESLDGRPLVDELAQGVRSWGTDATGPDVLVIGTYGPDGAVGGRLLTALPALAVVHGAEGDRTLLGVLERELGDDQIGQGAVLDRLLDLVLVGTLRAWFSRPGAGTPDWYAAQGDPVVGPALRLLHHRPEHCWTVASLATEVGASRAAFARRFTELVGEPPMTYLTGWRLSLAIDLLREPGRTLASVATAVGYGSPFALSAALKRRTGQRPRDIRLAHGRG